VDRVLQSVSAAQSTSATAKARPPPPPVDRESLQALALVETEMKDEEGRDGPTLSLEDEAAASSGGGGGGSASSAAAAALSGSAAMHIPELLKQLTAVLGSAGEMHRRSEEKSAKASEEQSCL
jgi:hypothetical protein